MTLHDKFAKGLRVLGLLMCGRVSFAPTGSLMGLRVQGSGCVDSVAQVHSGEPWKLSLKRKVIQPLPQAFKPSP